MIRLHLIAEIDVSTDADARRVLDRFREVVQPAAEYGITLYESDPMRRYPQLDPDAPSVPPGMRPRPGVEYGCGAGECTQCYEPDVYPTRTNPADLYTLDRCDWPLVINPPGDGNGVVCTFPLPEGSSGDDPAGLEQLRIAELMVERLNKQWSPQ